MLRLLLTYLFIITPIWAQQTTAPTLTEEEISSPEQAIAVSPIAKDDEIQKRISKILSATGWYENSSVRVDDGIVFLDGQTDSDEHRQWARNLASKTQDVVAVVNRIQVSNTPNWSMKPALSELERLLYKFIASLPLILLTVIVLPVAWQIAKYIHRFSSTLFNRQLASPLLADILAKAIAVPSFLLGVYIVLQVAGLTSIALSIMGGAGVVGIVIGFAFRDIAENFLASLLLSLRRPFTRGDLIKVADKLGIVQSMNTRTTVLLSSEGNLIQIPNSMVFKNIIHNYTASSSQRDIIDLGIGYDASISDTQSIILDLLSEHEALMQDPKPLVLVDNLGAATVNLKIYYWFDGKTLDRLKLRSSILRLLKRRLMEEGISLPDDAREIIFPNGVPVYLQNQSNLETPTISTTSTLASHEPAKEVSSTVTASEGNLTNERQEIEATAEVDLNQDCKNLLSNP